MCLSAALHATIVSRRPAAPEFPISKGGLPTVRGCARLPVTMLDRLTDRTFHPALGIAVFVSLTGMGALSAPAVRSNDATSGQQIFMSRCASCHGAKGEGTKRYARPLIGDKSVGQLATFIHQSMPPG